MKTRNLFNLIVLALAGIFTSMPALAQTPTTLTGTSYFTNFDGIAGGLPPGFNTYTNATSTTLGNLKVFTTTGNGWATSTGGFFNEASITNNDGSVLTSTATAATQLAVTNRILGIKQNAAFDPGAAVAFEVDGTTIGTSFVLSFDWLMLNSQTRNTAWSVDYGLGATPTFFTKIGTWTNGGFLPSQTNLSYFGTTNLSFSFGNALDNQNQPVWIRIVTLAGSTGSGSRNTFGLDNFKLTWSPPNSTVNPVVLTSQPTNTTVGAGLTATFSVNAGVSTSPTYQWFEVLNNVTNQLSDGPNPNGDGSTIAGSTGPNLVLSGVFGADSASYYVTVANTLNSVNSSKATLTVIDPVIISQPLNQTNVSGDITYFNITSVGTQPLQLIWYYNGSPVADASTNSFFQTNQTFIFITNGPTWINPAGFYLVASNTYGKATSTVATAALPAIPPGLITRWDFNETLTYPPYNPAPSIGSGTAAPATNGGFETNFLFVSGALADPQNFTAGVLNNGWEFQSGPTNGTANKQVGFQYNVSTAGYNNIHLTWIERHSATASKYMRTQYSTDGVTFNDGPVTAYSDVAYIFSQADLSAYAGLNNNPNAAFRIVAEFESTALGGTNGYVGTSSTYGPGNSGGTVRNDLFTVWGSPALNISVNNGVVTLSWAASGFVLQSSTNVNGPYTAVTGVTGQTYTHTYTDAQRYFRLHP